MKMKALLLITLILPLISSIELPRRTDRIANWSSFEILSNSSSSLLTDSRDFLADFPLLTFWDTLKGSYRLGTMGQLVRSLYPEHKHLTQMVPKTVHHAGQLHAVEHHVVDYQQVYMQMLLVVRYLDRLVAQIEAVLAQHSGLKLADQLAAPAQDQDASFADLAAEIERIGLMAAKADTLHAIEVLRTERAMALGEVLQTAKRAARQDLHVNLTHAMKAQKLRVLHNLHEHYSAREIAVDVLSGKEQETLEELLRLEHSAALQELTDAHAFQLQVLAYRTEAELAYIAGTEDVALHRIDHRMDLLRKGSEEVVDVLMKEFLAFLAETFPDLQHGIDMLKMLLLAILLGIAVSELSQSVRWGISRLFLRRAPLQQAHRTQSTAWFQRSAPAAVELAAYLARNQLVYGAERQGHLVALLASLQAVSQHSLAFPNVLLYGPPGCGKTYAAEMLVDVLNKECRFVCLSAADLLSLPAPDGHSATVGAGGSLYLNKLFQTTTRTLVIIDEADMLIASRGKGAVCNVLYALLEGLKTANRHIGVVFTTRLDMGEIDAAILDRMDTIIPFSLPDLQERCQAILMMMQAHLLGFMTAQSKAQLATMLADTRGICDTLQQIRSLDQLFHAVGIAPSSPEDEGRALSAASILTCLRGHQEQFGGHQLDLLMCLQVFLLCSQSWSLRDIYKKITSIRYQVLSSRGMAGAQEEELLLTTGIFMKELAADDIIL